MNPAAENIHLRHSIWRMFRDAADQDYLMARFAARSQMHYQFWWNAQQSVEKYLKAALLLNGKSISTNHELSNMYDRLSAISLELLPSLLCPPSCVRIDPLELNFAQNYLPAAEYVRNVEANGNPNNRYRTFSISTRATDLFHFDRLCFDLRRVCFPLDMDLSDGRGIVRSVLAANRQLQLHPKMGFQGVWGDKVEAVWDEHLKWCNFAYFYEEALEAAEYPSFGGSINAEPFLCLQNGSEAALDGLSWLASNAFPKALKKMTLKEIEEAKKYS